MGKRPPPAGVGVGSIPHSYASSLARLYRFGPISVAMTTEKIAKPAPRAPSTRMGAYAFTAPRSSQSALTAGGFAGLTPVPPVPGPSLRPSEDRVHVKQVTSPTAVHLMPAGV